MATPKDVAEWMLEKLKERGYLYQEIAVGKIKSKYGQEFTYRNRNGNLAIDKRVLKEFRKLTEKTVVWERGERRWRYRKDSDGPNKRQSKYY